MGRFADKDLVARQTNGWMEFDKLTVGREKIYDLREDRFISGGKKGFSRAYYRASLPSDTQLLQTRDFLSLSNLFGWNPFAQATNMTERVLLSVGIRYFALRPYDCIETVEVRFERRGQESRIDSILIQRGRFHPHPTPK